LKKKVPIRNSLPSGEASTMESPRRRAKEGEERHKKRKGKITVKQTMQRLRKPFFPPAVFSSGPTTKGGGGKRKRKEKKGGHSRGIEGKGGT